MDDELGFQTPAELEAQFADRAPATSALRWLTAFLEGRHKEAWALTDPNFRLTMAQEFLWANRFHPLVFPLLDPDETATGFASTTFDHPLWNAFEETKLGGIQREFTSFYEGATIGVASRPRPVTIDYELIKITRSETDEVVAYIEPTLVRAQVLLMHSSSIGWLVAGIGVDTPPEPGWPPTPGHATL